jgi:asparagine synthase (glutamine-hydrolysing)
MCGIAGFCRLLEAEPDGNEALLIHRMMQALRHRGPDDSGVWMSSDRKVVLGHTRLSILDLSPNGHQPMLGADGSVLVYNGELYNFQALRQQFVAESLRSTSDTEVLLRCYEADGESCLQYLNGMFAFALWDPSRKRLLLARDRVGIKPLYYTTLSGVFAFASEIKALLALPWVSAELDEEALSCFLIFNHLQAPATMFKGIAKFHAGYRMVVDTSGIQSYEPFWKPRWDRETQGSDSELQALVLRELGDSVRRQMVADVPVGIFLSGGVDSSGLVALASRNTEAPLTTYSIGFAGAPRYSELDYARLVARKFKTKHIERVVRREELAEFLPQLVEIYDEPLADATSIPIYFISQLARSNGTIVVLTGDGSDELFCGYRRWVRYARVLPWYRRYLRTPALLRKIVEAAYRAVDNSSPRYELLSQAAAGHEVYWGAGGFKNSKRQSVLSANYLERLAGKEPYQSVCSSRRGFEAAFASQALLSDVNWLCYNGLTDALPNFYCYRADRMGMANSVEIRVPYLDNRIVDLAFSLPSTCKLNGGEPKWILKKAFEPLLPREVLYRRKMGFCVPIREWAGETFARYIDDHLASFCRETGLFREEGLREQLRRASAGDPYYAFGLWNLYFLMVWMRRWILGCSA